jgi:Flp pilus assembly protein TadG
MRLFRQNSKGQVLVLVAALIFVLLGIAALALDIGRAYGIKARLNAAVDAASYEATKAIGQGSDEALMKNKAVQVATAYFNANYPAGYLGATPDPLTVTPVHDTTTGLWKVAVTATAPMPTFLSGVLGKGSFDIGASSESQRRSLDMVLVIDTSHSLYDEFDLVKTNAENYVGLFSEKDDRVGLVAFSTGAAPIVSICRDMNPPLDAPTGLTCGRGFVKGTVKPPVGVEGAINGLDVHLTTNSEEGMKKALDQLNSLASDSRSATRVIVFFSDGAPNTYSSKISLASGGTVDGNLYSNIPDDKTNISAKPNWYFDPKTYGDSDGTKNVNILAPLPTSGPVSGFDLSGTVPLASFNNRRSFSGGMSDTDVHCDANKAARNMVENVANMARSQGVIVFTLGLGGNPDYLSNLEVTDCGYLQSVENGTNLLKRMANTKDSDTYNASQPSGIYCYAKTTDDLKPCFDRIASAILRITK